VFSKLRTLVGGLRWRGAQSSDESRDRSSSERELPNLSNLARVARLRHIQSLHESGDLRNPDILVGELLAPDERERCLRTSRQELTVMREAPFYYYLVARTKFYDELLLEAVAAGLRRVVVLGSGSDTRLYRFGGHLATHGIEVAECDQPEAIAIKMRLARSLPHVERVGYLPADLNSPDTWSGLWEWLNRNGSRPTLVFAEGVSPYLLASTFERFLKELAIQMASGGWVVYDFKRPGQAVDRDAGQDVSEWYRLPFDESWVSARHASLGFGRTALVESVPLMRNHVPSWSERVSVPYREDALLRLWR